MTHWYTYRTELCVVRRLVMWHSVTENYATLESTKTMNEKRKVIRSTDCCRRPIDSRRITTIRVIQIFWTFETVSVYLRALHYVSSRRTTHIARSLCDQRAWSALEILNRALVGIAFVYVRVSDRIVYHASVSANIGAITERPEVRMLGREVRLVEDTPKHRRFQVCARNYLLHDISNLNERLPNLQYKL